MQTVTLSSLQHYMYCNRQCALMFVEGVWEDDKNTVAGAILHENVDEPGYENDEGDVKILRALPLYSKKYALSGKADAVELGTDGPIPVEYKKGRKKKAPHDDVQLCAQALCLEEMFHCEIPRGYIYHITSKRRREVALDGKLRQLTIDTITAVRAMLESGKVPPAVLEPKCRECSLKKICMPELTSSNEYRHLLDYAQSIWRIDK